MKNKIVDVLVRDVVCGMIKPKSAMKFTSEFFGKVYYFDTENDKLLFDAHPDYWVPQEEREKYRKERGNIGGKGRGGEEI